MNPKRQLYASTAAAVILGTLLLLSDWTRVSTFTLVVNGLIAVAFVVNVYVAWSAWRRTR
jgi:hypothetical protein